MATVKQKRAVSSQSTSATNGPFPRGVSQPALRALASAGYTHLDQLERAREKELRALHGMGPKALGILRAALQKRGKCFLP